MHVTPFAALKLCVVLRLAVLFAVNAAFIETRPCIALRS